MARILIVDDVEIHRNGLQRALADANPDWEVMVAEDEEEGLKKFAQQLQKGQPVDVVITDLKMSSPQGGMIMLQKARELDPWVMTILTTAYEEELDRYKAFEYGAFDVVEKKVRKENSEREIEVKTKAALRYQEWSRRINFLGRYFDRRLFARLTGPDDEALRLQKRTITICFWDIRGFTTLCDALRAHPDLVGGFIKDHSDMVAKTIFEHDGLLDKFIGDGVMALFGVLDEPGKDREAAVAAVRTATEVRRRFNDVRDKWLDRWPMHINIKPDIALRCGINTGEVLVGNIGTDFRDQFTALGDDVNFASRMESNAGDNGILLSLKTATRVKDRFTLQEKEVELKGYQGTYKGFLVT